MTRNFRKSLQFLVLVLLISGGVILFQNNLENFFYSQIGKPYEEVSFVQIPPRKERPELGIEANSVISLRVNRLGREKIVFEQESELVLPIASLTKLMTAVIVLEEPRYDLEKSLVKVSKRAADQIDVPVFGNLREGEVLSVKKLLDLMLFYSSNDAAFALAEVIGVEDFVRKMNDKAKELGLKNTFFINPTGLDPENIYYNEENIACVNFSNNKDLVKLSQYILENYPLIFDSSLEEGSHVINNGVSSLFLPENLKILGAKTGYTHKANGCILVILEDEKGNTFFNVVLGTGPRENRIKEVQKLINWIGEEQ